MTTIDEESKKSMIKELAIIHSLICDDDSQVDNLGEYFENLGI